MNINLNDTIKVRLTPLGRRVHKAEYLALSRGYPLSPYTPPKEDADGYSSWSVWCLMQTFGKHLSLGFDVPFETEMIYDEHNH